MLKSLGDSDLGVYGGGEYKSSKSQSVKLKACSFTELKPGLNEETVILGRVIGSVLNEEAVPL